ncbi:ABC transporter ATP-binding protein [Elioraea tepida]|jgi:oligopeptide/dipeptide ABC transporter ATP-binding protein|uniref:ABC transporter ATP-binding protein n=1 Tax=Elioraea tepida TaxID=2843330 RepID=A0A975U045_9PROT|nr:ABC transporter ATP-binding protein [Elioraea tepida]QXM23881.1 ABC transporter ATP-binding protein [Elioraea tepida]
MTAPLLAVSDLGVGFATDRGVVEVIEGLSFSVAAGRTLAIVGESGCGKSVTSLALMRLLPPNARVRGRAVFDGIDLFAASEAEMRALRGGAIAMIFQEPMTSLNPAFTVGDQIAEAIRLHRAVGEREAREEAVAMLARVRIPDARARARDWPHRLSGGMRQRVMIAMAMACRPKLLIADEPTTALDVTIQAQILELMREMAAESGTAIILITHDLGVVAEMADEVLVMYAGRAAEWAPARTLFAAPQHPYTVGLMGAIPRLDEERSRLATIEGSVPSPTAWPPGCRFEPRCPFAVARCREEAPALAQLGENHAAACWQAPLDRFAEAA